MIDEPGKDLHKALANVLGPVPGIAVIHSSFVCLMPPAEFAPSDAVFALERLVRAGWTIAIPAFTFSFCGGTSFHHRRSRSEVGRLADWMLEGLPRALRTPHPIYSFTVLGDRAEAIAACPSTTTFGDDSPFGLFERADATQVMLGCGFEFCTQFHRYEEQARVPYRYYKEFAGRADFGDGPKPATASMYVRDIDLDPDNDYGRAIARMQAAGQIRSVPLWREAVEAAATRSVAEQAKSLLAADPFALLANGPAVADALGKRTEAAKAAL